MREKAAHVLEGQDRRERGGPYLIDAVAHPAVLPNCLSPSVRGGRTLVFGVASPTAEATVRPNEIFTKEFTIVGIAINPFPHLRAVCLLRPLPISEQRTKTSGFKDATNAFDAVRVGQFDKVRLRPGSQATL